MAPQIVGMTTPGTTRDDKAANATIPCHNGEKTTNTTMIWKITYQSIIEQIYTDIMYILIMYLSQ